MKLNINLKKFITIGAAAALIAGMFSGCGSKATATTAKKATKPTPINASDADKKQLTDTRATIESVVTKAIQLMNDTTPKNVDSSYDQLKAMSLDTQNGFKNLGSPDDERKNTYKLNDYSIIQTTLQSLKSKSTGKIYKDGAITEWEVQYNRNGVNYKQDGSFYLVKDNNQWKLLEMTYQPEVKE